MRIKEVEDIVGITKKNIRFYEKEGLLTPGREGENSYRDYSPDDVARLKQIKLLRRLDMPISDIRELFQGQASLSQEAEKHSRTLDEHINSLEKARLVCGMLCDDPADISAFDVDMYLSKIDELEKEGAVFVNIRKNDVRKKYIGPVVSCIAIVAFTVLILAFFLYDNASAPAPSGVFWFFIAMMAMIVVGTVAALVSRIKEIRGGEENDLSNY
jgi:DNA-binding transcriptional MerR regulator